MKNNIKELKNRINVIKETSQITNAMQLISTSKYNKINDKYLKNLYYFDKVRETIAVILEESGSVEHSYFSKKPIMHTTYLVIASDTGLAGDYNNRVLKFALDKINRNEGNKSIFTIGHMAHSFFIKNNVQQDLQFFNIAQNPNIDDAIYIATILIDLYDSKLTDKIQIIYTSNDGIETTVKVLNLLPIIKGIFLEEVDTTKDYSNVKFEPSQKAVFDILVPQYIIGAVYTALIQAIRCEHSERMVTMHSATKNAKEILEKLNLEFNRERQEIITTEITEISSADLGRQNGKI